MALTAAAVNEIVTGYDDPLKTLALLGGYYECPCKDGQRLGPLVGYAGRDAKGRQYVGDVYFNWAIAEEWPFVLAHFAKELRPKMMQSFGLGVTAFCGAPLGGMTFGAILAYHYSGRFIFPEKKVRKAASATGREEADMVFSRHEPWPGESVAVVEDVLNNFSTTNDVLRLIRVAGANPRAIIGLLNRSLTIDNVFTDYSGVKLPVVALVRKPFAQYEQDDPLVAADVANGNVAWKPKNEWDKLMAAMNAVRE